MNRLLNRPQWGKSNDPTPVGIGLVLVEILGVELYSFIYVVELVPYTFNYITTNSQYFQAMNISLDFSHWDESNGIFIAWKYWELMIM